ncbi:hypothetical protein SAMN05444678_11639 [Sphingomonas sp. YR710]|uniref:ParB-like protein n=1 Tax=Sphingomonas sp. YR710 TaxID=1882773 RepID=UPI000885275F|nr:ParB-like protein [Sphingomonas sp. YR710]SDD56942.1 hypothetical protein SAMN05444678_11639 [Sphingomonas sp. YR710]
MRHDFEPLLHPIEISALRPTQMTVGLREVDRKRTEWRKHAERDGPDFLGRHMIPAVIGPRGTYFLVDHHHLVRALHDEGVTHVLVSVIADLGVLKRSAFWTFMDNRNWLHPFDVDGKRQAHGRIPKAIGKLEDDPYRSLAGELRRAGGFAKADMPYSEFLWADFLRRRVDLHIVVKDFEAAVAEALDYAHHPDARYLPGWCGAVE